MPGQLTREEMEQVIRDGGSVLIHPLVGEGQIHSNPATLPDETALAAIDDQRRQTLVEALDAQMAALAVQRQQLDQQSQQPSAPAPKRGKAAEEPPAEITLDDNPKGT